MKIYKWPIQLTGTQVVPLPKGARILTAQVQGNQLCVWALCDPSTPNEPRRIDIYGTGHDVPNNPGDYLTTFQLNGGDLVFHVFAAPNE